MSGPHAHPGFSRLRTCRAVVVDLMLMLSVEQLNIVRRYVESTYPEEGGGLLLGAFENGRSVVREVRAIPNTWDVDAEKRRRYLIPGPLLWLNEEPAAEARGLSIVGYFHSHPDHPAVPSDFDREHALPNWSYLIVAVHKGRAADALAWQLREDRSAFDPQEMHHGN